MRIAVEQAENGNVERLLDHFEKQARGDVRLAFAGDNDAGILYASGRLP